MEGKLKRTGCNLYKYTAQTCQPNTPNSFNWPEHEKSFSGYCTPCANYDDQPQILAGIMERASVLEGRCTSAREELATFLWIIEALGVELTE